MIPTPLVFGKEPILREDEIVGRLTSASTGWTVGRAVGLGYVTRPGGMAVSDLAALDYAIMVAGRPVRAVASLRPLYDPANQRMRD